MPGTFDDDAATTASVKSGVPGKAQSGSNINKPLPHEPTTSGTGVMGSSSTTTAGPHSSNLANQADPRVDSDLDRSRGLGSNKPTGSGLGGHSTTGPGSGLIGTSGGANAGPHTSNLANKVDPRVDSDLDGSRGLEGNSAGNSAGLTGSNLGRYVIFPTHLLDLCADADLGASSGYGNDKTGPSHIGRDTALAAGAAGAGAAAGPYRGDHESGRSFPLGGSSTNASGYSAPGQIGTYPAGGGAGPGSSTAAGPHSSNLANKADPRVDSDLSGPHSTGDTGHGSSALSGSSGIGYGPESWRHGHDARGHAYEGDPCAHGKAASSAPHFTSGPHSTDTANRLDPHVRGDADTLGYGTTSSANSGLGSSSISTAPNRSGTHHERDVAQVGGDGAADAATYGSRYEQPNSSNTGPAPNTAGPHKSDMLNKLDPRIDSDLRKQRGTTSSGVDASSTGSGLNSSSTGTTDPYSSKTGHHSGRDAGLTGAGLGGAPTYENKDHRGINNPASTTPTTGSSYPSSGVDESTATGRHHHSSRDAALPGAGTAPGYQAARPQGQVPQSSNMLSAGASSATTAGPHSSSLANKADPRVDSDMDGSRGPGSGTTGPGYDAKTGAGYHHGREAGLAGAGGFGAYETDKHLGPQSHATPQDRLAGSGSQFTTASTAAPPRGLEGQGNKPTSATGIRDPHAPSSTGHYTGRDAALGAGAGAGVGGLMGNEHLDEEAKRIEKAQHEEAKHAEKEAKKIEKEQHKEAKHAEKEAKKHDHHHQQRDSANDEKKPGLMDRIFHRHHDDKTDAAAERDAPPHDRATEKDRHLEPTVVAGATDSNDRRTAGGFDDARHGGHPVGSEMQHGSSSKVHDYPVAKETKAGTGTTDPEGSRNMGGFDTATHGGHPVGSEMQHGSSSGVHDTPIGSGITTHEAYGTTEGHNKLHKDPPAKVLEEHGS